MMRIATGYPPELTTPVREELVRLGVQELRTPEEVDTVLAEPFGTTLVFVNSVCGCAAGMARPGLAQALGHPVVPDRVTTVFAGVDREATERLRSYFDGHPASSPQVALFKDGELACLIQRSEIEGTSAEAVAMRLTAAFDQHCC